MRTNKHGIRILDKEEQTKYFYTPERKELYKQSSGMCFYCGKKLQIDFPNRKDYMTIDHFIPLSLGGENSIKNMVPACKKCNSEKGDKL